MFRSGLSQALELLGAIRTVLVQLVPPLATGMTPFKAMFGHEPRHWGITATTSCTVSVLQSWLEERATMQNVIQQQLHRARQLMKNQAEKKRSFRQFQVGDRVFLKLQPYIQTSIAPRANHKLSYKFYGPFTIIAKVNDVAYKLELPPQATVHPVFHVSQLRQALLPARRYPTRCHHPGRTWPYQWQYSNQDGARRMARCGNRCK